MKEPLGGVVLGIEPLGGDPLHDPPTVVVDAIGTITTGGPNISVSWVYSQIQGDPQVKFRVEVLDDALAISYFDSGFLAGADSSYSFDVDANEIPHDSTDVTARVTVESTGLVPAYHQGTDVEAYQIEFGVPHAAIDDPLDQEVWTDLSGVDVDWTFTDDRGGKIQSAYRVRLILTGPGLVLFDTGFVVSTDTTFNVPVLLNPGSRYTVELQLKNDEGIRSD